MSTSENGAVFKKGCLGGSPSSALPSITHTGLPKILFLRGSFVAVVLQNVPWLTSEGHVSCTCGCWLSGKQEVLLRLGLTYSLWCISTRLPLQMHDLLFSEMYFGLFLNCVCLLRRRQLKLEFGWILPTTALFTEPHQCTLHRHGRWALITHFPF